MDEEDIKKLSIEDRCQHKAWNARLSGYEAVLKLFEDQDDEKSPEFSKYQNLVKKFVVDSNAVAQEKGLQAVLAFVTNAACASKTTNEVMSGLVAKCFSSPRAKTRELALEITLMYIEIEKQDVVIDELVKGLGNKSPKVVASCVSAIRQALHLFGSQVISVKQFASALPKLLVDRDKSVREESKQLCIETYRWVGAAIKKLIQSVSALTLTELETEFEKISGETISPTRLLRSQQEKLAAAEENSEEGTNVAAVAAPTATVDAYDLQEAVDILSKLPKNFYEQCEDKKWQERKAALDTLLQLSIDVKLESGDYGDLVRILKKIIAKDSNIVVATTAVKCLTNLVTGLRKKFQTYASVCIPVIFEKFKEKKPNVIQALREAIDALYSVSSLENMLEDIQAALSNKNPQIRAETCAFLARAFCSCSPRTLNKKLLKALTEGLLKTLNDTDATVREKSAEAIGTAMKVVGENAMPLKDVDAIKMTKIKEFAEKAEVKQVSGPPTAKPPAKAVVREAVPPKVSQPEVRVNSAPVAKPKTTSAPARVVRGGAKKPPCDVRESEFKEQDLSPEDVLAQVSEILPSEVINGLTSANWKDRLSSAEKFLDVVQKQEKELTCSQSLIKLLVKKPGLKENNIQVLKIKFEILSYIAENSKVSHVTVESCLSDIVDKIGDAKSGTYAATALNSLAGATSLDYISQEVLNTAFSQKNPKNQSEALNWLSGAIKKFGLKLKLKETVENVKKGFASTNPGVRNAALSVTCTMYLYIGKPLRSFFESEKTLVLQQIDAEFEKLQDIKPPLPEVSQRAQNGEQGSSSNDRPNLEDLMPRVDISSQITSELLQELSDKDWHVRSESLTKVSNMITEAKLVTSNLGDLPNALRSRLTDTNKRLAVQALAICELLGTALGSQCPKQLRNFAPGILACLGDNKANVRAAAVQCLNSWMENCPLSALFEGETISEALKPDNPFLRIELFSWLTVKMATATSLPASDLSTCVPVLLNCLEDRNPDVRKKASDCLLPFMTHVGYETVAREAKKLKPTSANNIMAQLEKVRPNLPVRADAALSKPKQRSAFSASEKTSVNASAEENKGKITKSTSKTKIATKAPTGVSAKAKKEEEVDTSPWLALNNLKEQRMADEKALKVLKWNFSNPREEFYVQLKDQMITANWNLALITHCFHNDFKFHIKAIDLFIESLKSSTESSGANLDLILKWLALRFFDTNPSVLIKSLEYLQVLFQALSEIEYRLLEQEATSFVPYLILKIGDPKEQVRKGVREIIKCISRVYPYSKLFSFLMNGLCSKNARQRTECLEELGFMIETYGVSVCQPSPAAALKEIARQISDRDNGVRNAALNCVVQAYFLEGEKVYKFIGQLSDKDQSLLDERIKRSTRTKIKSAEITAPTPKPLQISPTVHVVSTPKTSILGPPRTGPLRLDTEDIEQMFKSESTTPALPG